jgi:hypothetical protein
LIKKLKKVEKFKKVVEEIKKDSWNFERIKAYCEKIQYELNK